MNCLHDAGAVSVKRKDVKTADASALDHSTMPLSEVERVTTGKPASPTARRYP